MIVVRFKNLIFIRQMATPPGSEISIKNRSPLNRFLYLCVYPLNLKRQFLLGDVPPWLYLRVFFAVGLPKERALSTLVSRWSQHTKHGTVCDPWSHSIVFKFMRISIFKIFEIYAHGVHCSVWSIFLPLSAYFQLFITPLKNI